MRMITQSAVAMGMAFGMMEPEDWATWERQSGGGGMELYDILADFAEKSAAVAKLLRDIDGFDPLGVHPYTVDEPFANWLGFEIRSERYDWEKACNKLHELCIEQAETGSVKISVQKLCELAAIFGK